MTHTRFQQTITGLALYLAVAITSRAALSTSQDWQFTTGANPAAPTAFNNLLGEPTASIAVGHGGIGWRNSLAGFGAQTGLWDLGGQNPDSGLDTRGVVSLRIPNEASSELYTVLTLRVVQFVGGPYVGTLTFSLSGGTYVGQTTVEVIPSNQGGGSWVEDTYNWNLTPSPGSVALDITGAAGGTFLDRIRVDNLSAVPEPVYAQSMAVAFLVVTMLWSSWHRRRKV